MIGTFNENDIKVMRRKITLFILTVLLIAACYVLPSGAFDDNDYDGGWDDGGGGWDDGGGWDGGGDWDSDGGGGDGDYKITWIHILIYTGTLALGVYAMIAKNKKKRQGIQIGAVRRSSDQGMHIQLPDRTEQIESIIKEHDTNFSANDFISFVKRVYIDIQLAWCKRDLSPVRVFLHDNLYDATVQQIQVKIDQGVIYHYESMVVNTAYLTSYAKDEQFEYLTVYLNARMIDWQEDEKTGKILRGDKTTRWDLRYKLKFMRSAGVATKEEIGEERGHNCPNCGAPLEMTSSAKCAYCGSVVTTGQYSWVLSDFGTIRNDTVDEGIRSD
jgi:hypothetical protein